MELSFRFLETIPETGNSVPLTLLSCVVSVGILETSTVFDQGMGNDEKARRRDWAASKGQST